VRAVAQQRQHKLPSPQRHAHRSSGSSGKTPQVGHGVAGTLLSRQLNPDRWSDLMSALLKQLLEPMI
jgi:hypothetical protein